MDSNKSAMSCAIDGQVMHRARINQINFQFFKDYKKNYIKITIDNFLIKSIKHSR